MIDGLCRCGRHPIECGCDPDSAMLIGPKSDWSDRISAIGRRLRAGENVVSLDAYRRRREWNRHVRETWGGDDHAA